MAKEAGVDKVNRQPNFGSQEDEDQPVFTHNVQSGLTPAGASDDVKAVLRMGVNHPGVPGGPNASPIKFIPSPIQKE